MKKKCIKCRKPLTFPVCYGLHESCFLKWFDLPQVYRFKDLDSKRIGTSSDQWKVKKKTDTFYHGRYLKYSAQLNKVDYILKVQEKKYLDLPGMEYTCNRIAKLLSLEVPKHYLIILKRRPTFVTYNFMQDYQKSTLDHIYKFLPKGEEYHNCSELIQVIKKETGHLADVVQFIKICLFDAFIGNNDRHGRNLGIITMRNRKQLAPMYDNPSYFGVETEDMLGADLNPSCSIWTTSSKEPKLLDYIEEFHRLGFEKVCMQFKNKLLTQMDCIKKEISKSYISIKRKKAFWTFLKKRIKDCEKF